MNNEKKPLKFSERKAHVEDCPVCRKIRESGGNGPTHDGSFLCRMRVSIASGGKKAHCTCRACF